MSEYLERAKNFIRGRAGAYHRVFVKGGVDTNVVLADLAKFCRATESTFHANPAISDRLNGRREVFLRIQEHLNLSTDELFQLYGTGVRPTKGE